MKLNIDKTKLGVTYHPYYLLMKYGSDNCYLLGKEAYVLDVVQETTVIHCFIFSSEGCRKIAKPSRKTQLCIMHELLWVAYDRWVRNYEPTRREPTEADMAFAKRINIDARNLPIEATAPREYGKVEYLLHKIYLANQPT